MLTLKKPKWKYLNGLAVGFPAKFIAVKNHDIQIIFQSEKILKQNGL